MKTGTAVALGGGALALVGAGLYVAGSGNLSRGLNLLTGATSGCAGSATGGLTATINPSYKPQTIVEGPSPGPAGQHAFPFLWAIAPQTLPTSGYQGGPRITRTGGYVYLVVAVNMAVSGTTASGENAATLGPWVGIAEYDNGTLKRVYPQLASAFGGQLTTLGEWSGGGA